MVIWDEIDLQTEPGEPRGRTWPDGAQLGVGERSHVARARQQSIHEGVRTVRAGEHNPVVPGGPRAHVVQQAVILGRHHLDERRFNGFGAFRFEKLHELARLIARSGHEHAAAEERPGVKPAEMLAQRHDRADDQQCGAGRRLLMDSSGEFLQRTSNGLLGQQRSVGDDGRGLGRRTAV